MTTEERESSSAEWRTGNLGNNVGLTNTSKLVCDHDYAYKILHDHTAADVCTKCGYIKTQRL